MAKKEILIRDNNLFFFLKPLYQYKSYEPKDTEYRETVTAIEIRKKIKDSFVFVSGIFIRSKDILEIEGKSQIIKIRRLSAKEEYFLSQGLPMEDDVNGKNVIDPETRFRQKQFVPKPEQRSLQPELENDEIPF